MFTVRQQFLTLNDCFIANERHVVKGIMIHSTGANNPRLSRYVQPDDGLLGVNRHNNSWNTPRPSGRAVCVHAFIGQLADGTIATYQTLPWEIVGWHSGSGPKGSANRLGYVGVELCEDDLKGKEYFMNIYAETIKLCIFLCQKYNLNPLNDIITHAEGRRMGIASNHRDVLHWFPKHRKNMDMLRADVNEKMRGATLPAPVLAFKVGDEIDFQGSEHFVSANAIKGRKTRPGRARVTAVFPAGRQQYHVKATRGSNSSVNGWVYAKDVH